MESLRGMENIIGLMGHFLKDILKMDSDMDMEYGKEGQ